MARREGKRWVRPAVKGVLAVLVLAAVGRHVAKTWGELASHGGSLRVEPVWLVVAGIVYVAGLAALGVVFGRVLAAGAEPVALGAAVRAYLISHLGKYVPGKAMVVVMRVGLVTPYGARPATAAFATFYETFAMMASGCLVAALGFTLGPAPLPVVPVALSLALAVAFLVVVEPGVFPRLTRLATSPFPDVGRDAMPRLTYGLLGSVLAASAFGWVLLGLSQVAVVRAFSPGGVAFGLWPVLVAGVALATVAGFVVAVLPAGLGVREGVLMTTLAPGLGADRAVVAALALRLTWVLAEVAAAAGLALVRPRPVAAGAGTGG